MSLRNDDRGVTPQIGFILIFGILVVFMSIYQAQVVPAQNQKVEYRHSQDVQSDMVKVRSALLSAAASGTSPSATVTLGTRYPTRILFVNPPPVTGTLKTKDLGYINISNVTIPYNDETRQYWQNKTEYSYRTKALIYETDYYYYDNAPSQIVYQNTGVYSNYSDAGATIIESKPILIRNHTITIITLTGNLSRSGLQTTAIEPSVLSGPYHEVHITNESQNITITLPTTLPPQRAEEVWNRSLGANNEPVTDIKPKKGQGKIVLTLEPGTYTLQMAKLGVGAGAKETAAVYLTTDMRQNLSVSPGEKIWLEVQVRDKFNNPEAGKNVTFKITKGEANFVNGRDSVRIQSDDDGSADARLEVNKRAAEKITVSCTIGNYPYELVNFTLTVPGDDPEPSECTGTDLQMSNLQGFSAKHGPNRFDLKQIQAQSQDGDKDLDRIELKITDESGTVRATRTIDPDGLQQQIQRQNLKISSENYDIKKGKTYTLTATAYDADGNCLSKKKQDTA